MIRFTLYSELKPEKVEDYINLHKEPWKELMELLEECNIHHYSISLKGNEVFTYYEYTGENYEKDQKRLNESKVMKHWWKYSKPCFKFHEQKHYYDDLNEVFYKE